MDEEERGGFGGWCFVGCAGGGAQTGLLEDTSLTRVSCRRSIGRNGIKGGWTGGVGEMMGIGRWLVGFEESRGYKAMEVGDRERWFEIVGIRSIVLEIGRDN